MHAVSQIITKLHPESVFLSHKRDFLPHKTDTINLLK